ncbi:Corticotropin-releasing factor receptor 2 [Chelonia mydas]|uniref:Corticotropin-releasing factor receptor 2 n=1 Tax=Chelonia mydas TaxID=8469 RepID=M7AXD7_CHEMY|nr:Corticotropin-releasing factor receptor 2 [Chelonia mydas]
MHQGRYSPFKEMDPLERMKAQGARNYNSYEGPGQFRKAVKATLVLLPLLGITYMLFFVNPGEDDISQIVFIYFNSFLQSFQGFFVSVFYCFLNGEVRSAARKRWHRWQDHHALRVRVARAMSIPTSPTRISFHSIKQTAAV